MIAADPRISVIVPVLNEAQILVDLVASLEDAFEVIIVDGGSTDNTRALAEPLDCTLLQSKPGRAVQMNAGAGIAKGEVLLFLHADTRLPVGFAGLIRSGLQSKAQVWGRFDIQLTGRHPMFRVIEWMMNARSRLTGICTGDQAMFVHRDTFAALQGFADMPLMEDIELSSRLRRLGHPVCINARAITSSRRWEQHGIFSTIWLMWRLRLRYFLGADPGVLARAYTQ